MTIRQRYVLRLVLLTLLASAVLAVSTTLMSRARQIDLVVDDARDAARLVAHIADDTTGEVVDQLVRQDGEIEAITVFDEDRNVVVQQGDRGVEPPDVDTLEELLAQATPENPQPVMVEGTTLTTIATVSRPETRLVVIRTSIANATEFIARNVAVSLGLAALVALGAALVAWVTARRLADPISRLDAAADDLQRGEYDAERLEPVTRRSDELGRMARRFDAMAVEVQAREATLRDQVAALQVRIDEGARRQRVDEIVGSEGFADLEDRARRMRERRAERNGRGAGGSRPDDGGSRS
ncbi:MAG: HAMP domain-containing protein [Candidatus Nanopelagicales bacterium]